MIHRQFQYILCTGLLLLLLASTSVAQDDEKREEEWQEFLSGIARIEDASIVVDIDMRRRPPSRRFSERGGMETLERLGVLLNRGVRNIDGSYVFHRYMTEDDLRARSIHVHAMSWLRFLSGEDREELLSGKGLAWGSLSPDDKKSLEYVVRKLGGGVGDIMMSQAGDSIRMGVFFTPQIEFEDSNTGVTHRISISSTHPQMDDGEDRTENVDRASGSKSVREIARPAGGELDFGDGEMLSLAELFKRSVQQWGMRFWYDGRLAESLYFVSGRFDKDRFMKCIEEVTRTVETKKRENDLDLVSGALVDDLMRSYFENTEQDAEGTTKTIGDFLNGGSATLFEILGPNASQEILLRLKSSGISMNQQVRMKSAMALFFTAPGSTRIEDSAQGRSHLVGNTFGLSYRGS